MSICVKCNRNIPDGNAYCGDCYSSMINSLRNAQKPQTLQGQSENDLSDNDVQIVYRAWSESYSDLKPFEEKMLQGFLQYVAIDIPFPIHQALLEERQISKNEYGEINKFIFLRGQRLSILSFYLGVENGCGTINSDDVPTLLYKFYIPYFKYLAFSIAKLGNAGVIGQKETEKMQVEASTAITSALVKLAGWGQMLSRGVNKTGNRAFEKSLKDILAKRAGPPSI